MAGTAKAGTTPITFSGVSTPLTLTSSTPISSDAFDTSDAKQLTIYPIYTAGAATAGNKLNYKVEFCPLTTGSAWFQVGTYIDTTGTWNAENALYATVAGTASTALYATPLVIPNLSAMRMRITVTETGSGTAGTCQFYIVTNTIN